MALQTLQREWMHLFGGLAAGAGRNEKATACMIRDGFRQDAAATIVGTDEQYSEWGLHMKPCLQVSSDFRLAAQPDCLPFGGNNRLRG